MVTLLSLLFEVCKIVLFTRVPPLVSLSLDSNSNYFVVFSVLYSFHMLECCSMLLEKQHEKWTTGGHSTRKMSTNKSGSIAKAEADK